MAPVPTFALWLILIAPPALAGGEVLRYHSAEAYRDAIRDAPGTYVRYSGWPDDGKLSTDMVVEHVWSVVPDASDEHGNGVFASSQYWYQNAAGDTVAGGYMGSQVIGGGSGGKERTVFIFSCWDSDPRVTGTALRVGWTTDATCERFGGEGVGSHCILDVPIVRGRLYSFRVHLDSYNKTGAMWKGVVTDSVTGKQRLVGTLFLPNANPNEVGFGYLEVHSNEFLEYFNGGDCDLDVTVGVGTFGPWFQNRTVAASSAQPAYSASNCTRTLVTGCIPDGLGCGFPRVYVQGGAGVVRNNTNEDQLWAD